MEHILHNVTVALRCVDGNSRRVLMAPIVQAAGQRLIRNRSGDYVLLDRPELTSLAVTVDDPARGYLPRRASVALPRSLDPEASNSIFRPVELVLYPAPAAAVASGWAVIRATVVDATTNAPLPGALLRVTRAGSSSVIARGMTEWRGHAAGEAQVAVPGIPAITFGAATAADDGAVLVSQVAVSIEAIVDPAQLFANAILPDPDDLEVRRTALPHASLDLQVSAGAAKAVRIAVPI